MQHFTKCLPTENRLNILSSKEQRLVVLTEEMAVDPLTSEQKDVAVAGDGAMGLVGVVKIGTLSLRLHGTNYVRKTKQ